MFNPLSSWDSCTWVFPCSGPNSKRFPRLPGFPVYALLPPTNLNTINSVTIKNVTCNRKTPKRLWRESNAKKGSDFFLPIGQFTLWIFFWVILYPRNWLLNIFLCILTFSVSYSCRYRAYFKWTRAVVTVFQSDIWQRFQPVLSV